MARTVAVATVLTFVVLLRAEARWRLLPMIVVPMIDPCLHGGGGNLDGHVFDIPFENLVVGAPPVVRLSGAPVRR
jgi:hypothetical protein